MRVVRSPVIIKHSPFRRPIYMVATLAGLRRMRIASDVVKLNIVVLKPMRSQRSLNALFRGYPWMENRLVTYIGVQAVPDVLREDGAFTPAVHSARLQGEEGQARQALRNRILNERRKKARFNGMKDVLQKTQSVVRLHF
jgi:hypothetical protein